ncbi:MAG: hypothetical protein ABIM78_06300 [candidate division WOR-3 bacterium]
MFYLTLILLLFSSCFNKKNFLIQINKKGGLIGFHEEFILINNELIYRDKNKNIEILSKIPENKIKTIKEIIENLKEGTFGRYYPDCIIYEIILKDKKIIYIPGFDTKEENLDKLIEILNEIILK